MEWQAWFTIAVVIAVFIGLARGIAGPDLVMLAGLVTLGITGVLTEYEAFAGFANPAMLTIGALFVLSAALRETGAMDAAMGRLLGRAQTADSGLRRLLPPVAALSAILNNTTIVALMTPLLLDWAKRFKISPSRLLIPLSYCTIFGATMTIMGTSVNLTSAGLMHEARMVPMGFFELLPVGAVIYAVGLVYLLFAAPHLLPARRDPVQEATDDRREYTAAMLVLESCPLVGQTIEIAGLRSLPGLFLVEIQREGHSITPVGPDEIIHGEDRLVFAGVIETIVDLHRIRGLVPAADDEASIEFDTTRQLAEAVVSRASPLVGQTIRSANFRSTYNAAVVAVHRSGHRVDSKLGDVVLRPGDTLLLQAGQGFARAHGSSRDFYLVNELPDTESRRHHRAGVAVAILTGLILVTSTGLLDISIAAFTAAGLLIATRCISGTSARKSIHWPILVVIGSALGIASAMQKTGAAEAIAQVIVRGADGLSPLVVLGVLYFSTTLLSELLNHNASVAIMFPIAFATAQSLGVEPRGFIMGITIAASCAFANPVSYQTHLIVYGPGGYRFSDFVRVGLPLDLLCGVIALSIIPHVWPL